MQVQPAPLKVATCGHEPHAATREARCSRRTTLGRSEARAAASRIRHVDHRRSFTHFVGGSRTPKLHPAQHPFHLSQRPRQRASAVRGGRRPRSASC